MAVSTKNMQFVLGLVDAAMAAQSDIDRRQDEAIREFVNTSIDTEYLLEAMSTQGLNEVANALLPPTVSVKRTNVRARVYFATSEQRCGRVGVGIVATPIEAYYEASFGSTKETESVLELEIQRIPINTSQEQDSTSDNNSQSD